MIVDSAMFDPNRGGPMLWAIFALSCASWGAIAWVGLSTRERARRALPWRDALLDCLSRGHREEAQALCGETTCLGSGTIAWLLSLHDGHAARMSARARALLESEHRDTLRHLPTIAAMAAVALLLGLLGTIVGMVTMFEAVAATGTQRAESLADGMSQALLTTQAGLLVALPVMVMHRLLHRTLAREGDRAALHLNRVIAALARVTPDSPQRSR